MTHTTLPERHLRVALYSHDAQGLGHIRRNLAIAHALRRSGSALDLLLLTSAPEAAYAGRPSGCDIVSIPALAKDERGRYHSRHLSVGSEHLIATPAVFVASSSQPSRPCDRLAAASCSACATCSMTRR
jgi:predicted glycosyltransferase